MGQGACRSWTAADIPDLSGKTAVVTGANSGIGYHTAVNLGRKGAKVFIICRDRDRANTALEQMRAEAPQATFELIVANLADISDVGRAAADISSRSQQIDILVNNAGVMMIPKRELSPDGFEMQMATNHLGHFALTGHLLPLLLRSDACRVVNVSSLMAWTGDLKKHNAATDFVGSDETYSRQKAYGNSKLANLVFTRMLAKKYPKITAVAAHPGATRTNLQRYAFGGAFWGAMMQDPATGALPSLRAATEPGLPSLAYYGPWFAAARGVPSNSYSHYPSQANDDTIGEALWSASAAATGLTTF